MACPRIYRVVVGLSAIMLVAVSAPPGVGAADGAGGSNVILTPLDGPVRRARLRGISAAGEVRLEAGGAARLRELRSIERVGARVRRASDHARLFLRDGGEVRCLAVAFAQGAWRARWLVPLELPPASVRALLLGGGEPARKVFFKKLREARSKPPAEDRVVVTTTKGPRVLACVVTGLDRKRLLVRYRGKERRIGRDKICGLVLAGRSAPSTPEETTATLCRLTFVDGSCLLGREPRLRQGRLSFRLPAVGAPLSVAWEQVVRLEPRCGNLVYLSDLTPAEESAHPLVTFRAGWQRDRSVLGRPLTLAGRTFARGVGVHACSRLTYDLGGKYRVFAAVVGIDAETDGGGDCVFRVFVDGGKVWEKRLRGTDAPKALRVDVAGARRLVLEVDAGEGLDIADHADWADARLLK